MATMAAINGASERSIMRRANSSMTTRRGNWGVVFGELETPLHTGIVAERTAREIFREASAAAPTAVPVRSLRTHADGEPLSCY
jgi:hypothetical protein